MNKHFSDRRGAAIYLVLAILLTLLVVSTAILLNNMHKAYAVPAIAFLKADYQMESAIVMQMQKTRNETEPPKSINFSKELSPGYLLLLHANDQDNYWQFKVTVNGPGFSRSISAKTTIQNPDRIIYLQ